MTDDEQMTDDELGGALRAAFGAKAFDPAEQRLVRFAQLAAPHVRRARARRIFVVTSLLAIGSVGTAAAVAPHGIRIGGIEIFVDESPHLRTSSSVIQGSSLSAESAPIATFALQPTIPSESTIWPGEAVTLEEAKRRYKSRVRLPSVLRGPKALFWLTPPSTGQITAVWSPSRQLPEMSDPKVGLLLTQFRGTASWRAVVLKKTQINQTSVEAVAVNKSRGAWIVGQHIVVIVDDSGERTESQRLVGNTLLWAEGMFTYRLEGSVSKGEALRIARSVK